MQLSPELDVLVRALKVELHVDTAHGFPRGYTPFMLAVEVMKVLNEEGWELRRVGSVPRPLISRPVATNAVSGPPTATPRGVR
jgi:hypothetical protein